MTLINQINQKNIWFVTIGVGYKGTGYKLEPYVCNKCHDISMMAYKLENIAILNVKAIDYRCVLCFMEYD